MKVSNYKEMKTLEKSLNDSISVVHHEMKKYTITNCQELRSEIKQQYEYYTTKCIIQLRQSFDVDGIVDSSFESHSDARAQGKWKSLAEWLKDNDELQREKFEMQERRIEKLMAEIKKFEPITE